MAQTADFIGNAMRYTLGVGVNAADVVIQTGDVSRYNNFRLQSSAGAMDVLVSLDGTNYSTAPLSLTDMGGTAAAPVIVTAAARTYGFSGPFAKIRVRQSGATPVADACLICSQ